MAFQSRTLLFLLVLPALAQTRFAHFESRALATDLKGGYQVVVTDVNKDGKPDLVALASGMTELLWFEAPNWERHVLATGLKRMINTWPLDTDHDGIPEFLVAHAFENEAARSVGIVSLLTHGADVRQPWTVREIDRLTTSTASAPPTACLSTPPLPAPPPSPLSTTTTPRWSPTAPATGTANSSPTPTKASSTASSSTTGTATAATMYSPPVSAAFTSISPAPMAPGPAKKSRMATRPPGPNPVPPISR